MSTVELVTKSKTTRVVKTAKRIFRKQKDLWMHLIGSLPLSSLSPKAKR